MTAKGKKKPTQMDIVSAGYEDFIKRQKLADNGKDAFDKVIKKAITKKPRSAK